MISNIFNSLLLCILIIFAKPVYSIEFSDTTIEKYTLKISNKFSNTYCNSIKFGISKDGALKFSIGETNKEFSNNKFNKYINYELLNKNILLRLENNCNIYDFPENELENLTLR
tara:strand:- start:148 stop:489 length:342 start_codon:yes stop_codon:yes gene_type:complete